MTDNDKQGHNADGTFSQSHGGAGALKSLREGKPFSGLPAERRRELQAALDSEGAQKLLEDLALDFATVSDLYRAGVFSALEAGDTDKATALIRVWGWVSGHAIRALDLVCKMRKGGGKALDYEQVLEQEQQRHDTD